MAEGDRLRRLVVIFRYRCSPTPQTHVFGTAFLHDQDPLRNSWVDLLSAWCPSWTMDRLRLTRFRNWSFSAIP